MGKKKKKVKKHQNEPDASSESEDDTRQNSNTAVLTCPHLNRAINLAAVRKNIKPGTVIGVCQDCEGPSKSDTFDRFDPFPEDPIIWLCLQCGHQGCDRNSVEKHALHHFKTPRSDSHAVVLNTALENVWCYDCDDDIPVSCSKKLKEIVEFVKKLATSKLNTTAGTAQPAVPIEVKEKTENKKQESANKGKKVDKVTPVAVATLPKVKGLSNLGNTCFFNAVLQCLTQTHCFTAILDKHSTKGAVVTLAGGRMIGEDNKHSRVLDSIQLELSEAGSLTVCVAAFLRDMHSTSKNGVISPGQVLGQVCKKAPQFKGAQQQDSHELLRHLLDGMRVEEIKREKAGILKAFGLHEKTDPKSVNEDTKHRIKGYGTKANHTVVDKVFGGQMISTVTCEECHMSSQVFEPFLDLSLPVAEEKPIRVILPKTAVKNSNETLNAKGDYPSKYQSKKAKQIAKKDAKIARAKQRQNKLKAELETELETEEKQEDSSVSTSVSVVENSNENSVRGPDSGVSDADIEDNEDGEGSHLVVPQETNDKSILETMMSSSKDIEVVQLTELNSGSGDHPGFNTRPRVMGGVESEVDSICRKLDDTSIGGVESEIDSICRKLDDTSICKYIDDDDENTDTGEIITDDKIRDCNGKVGDNNDIEKMVDNCVQVCDISVDNNVKSRDCSDKVEHESSKDDEDVKKLCVDVGSADGELGNSVQTRGDKVDHELGSSKDNEDPCVDAESRGDGELRHSVQTRGEGNVECEKAPRWIPQCTKTLSSRYHSASHECSILSCLNQFTAPELLTGNNRFGCKNCTKKKHTASPRGKQETVYCNASKQMLIFSPPAILTLHLKRFQQVGYSLRKVNRHVEFPLVLDLSPFCSSVCLSLPTMKPNQTKVLYSLYGVVEHSGRLTGGHYVAYVKVRSQQDNVLAFLNDSKAGQDEINRLIERMRRCEGEELINNSASSDTPSAPTGGKWYYVSDSHVSEASETQVLKSQAYLLFYERIY